MDEEDEAVTKAGPSGFPFYYGLVIDKLIVALQIVFWWIVTIPLIILAVARTVVLYIILFVAMLVPLIFATLLGITLFAITLYWTPAISIALTQMAPLIAAGVEIGVFVLNLAWTIMIILIDAWNILIPLFVVVFIYLLHFLLTIIHIVVNTLTSTQLTSLFNQLIEIGFFFADAFIVILTTLVSLLPAALTLAISLLQPVMLLIFKIISFLLPALEFLFLLLVKLLPPVFMALLKLIKVFSSLLRYEPAMPSESPRYQAGVDNFFNTLVENRRDYEWQQGLDAMDVLARGQLSMPDYSHITNPLTTSRGRSVGGSGGSLHERYTAGGAHEKRGLDYQYLRADIGHTIGAAISHGFHSVLDTAAPFDTHMELIGDTLDRAAGLFGHASARHALDNYQTRYGHPALWLADNVPDIYGSKLGRMMRDSDPDHPTNKGMTTHEWRRADYPPVTGHPNHQEINRQVREAQPHIIEYSRRRAEQARDAQAPLIDPVTGKSINLAPVQVPDTGIPQGSVPLPFEIPVVLGSNCYTSNPKFILCLPRPKPRRFKAPEILIPTNLPAADTCPGFIPPPDPADGWSAVLKGMFNPATVFHNAWIWLRYLLSAFSLVFYGINQLTVTSPWLGWFFSLFSLGHISDAPLQLEELICMIPYAWYPLIAAVYLLIPLWGFPLLWLAISLVVIILLPFRKTMALSRNLLLYYELSAQHVKVLDTRSTVDVARQKWMRDQAVMRDSRGRAEIEQGASARDSAGEKERLRSRTFTEQRVESELESMSTDQVHRLWSIRKDVAKQRKIHAEATHRVRTLTHQLHSMGALSPHILQQAHSRMHMSRLTRWCPRPSHTSTLSFMRDMITNVEVAFGHRALSEAVPMTAWEAA